MLKSFTKLTFSSSPRLRNKQGTQRRREGVWYLGPRLQLEQESAGPRSLGSLTRAYKLLRRAKKIIAIESLHRDAAKFNLLEL